MKSLSNKKKERKEKKKAKILALANLVKMNDGEKREAAKNHIVENINESADFIKEANSKDASKSALQTEKRTSFSDEDVNYEPSNKRVTKANSDVTNAEEPIEPCQQGKLQITEEQYEDLKRQLAQRKRELKKVFQLRLRETGYRAQLLVPREQRTPIFLNDLQHLLMSVLIGKQSPCIPDRWCTLENAVKASHIVVLIVEGISLYDYLPIQEVFKQTNEIFETRLEVVLPKWKDGSIVEEIAQVPLTNVQAQKLIDEHGSLESAVQMIKDPSLLVKAIFKVNETSKSTQSDLPVTDKFPRTKLLLSALQMVDEGYPMPLIGELNARFSDFILTKDEYEPVTDSSPMFGVDCEMCRTVVGANELTRISIVNEQFQTVYETLVRPTNTIVDYLTRYSGITPEIMKTVTKTLADVQEDVKNLLPPDAILVGQSLNFDLQAMKMLHPYVIDTSVCFNLSGVRRRKAKLQTLAMQFLQEAIQDKADGHDSVEDSIASLKLVKKKLANSLEYGDEILIQKKRFNEIKRMMCGDSIKNNLFSHLTKRDKRTAIITAGTLEQKMKEIIEKAQEGAARDSLQSIAVHEVESNKQAIKKARELALEHSLTIANLSLCYDDDNLNAVVEKLDKWIGKMWKTVANNGLFMVLMGGRTAAECNSVETSDHYTSGIAKIAIKNNKTEALDKPAETTTIST